MKIYDIIEQLSPLQHTIHLGFFTTGFIMLLPDHINKNDIGPIDALLELVEGDHELIRHAFSEKKEDSK